MAMPARLAPMRVTVTPAPWDLRWRAYNPALLLLLLLLLLLQLGL